MNEVTYSLDALYNTQAETNLPDGRKVIVRTLTDAEVNTRDLAAVEASSLVRQKYDDMGSEEYKSVIEPLAELGAEVYSVEIIPELANHACKVLSSEGHTNVHIRIGDGYKGWPAHSPFDAVIVTCAPDDVPTALVNQLREDGRMIVPVGSGIQRLIMLRKRNGHVQQENSINVRFVPMVHGSK